MRPPEEQSRHQMVQLVTANGQQLNVMNDIGVVERGMHFQKLPFTSM